MSYDDPRPKSLPSQESRERWNDVFGAQRTLSHAYVYEHALPGETFAEAEARLRRELRDRGP